MQFLEYTTNSQWSGGELIYDENAKETLRMMQTYDWKMCEECHYFDEAGNEMTRADFEAHFLKLDSNQILIDPPCDCFEITIDQSNRPQVLLVRPKPTTKDKGKRVVRWFQKRFRNILWPKNAA